MKNQTMLVPPRAYQRGRNFGIIVSTLSLACGLLAQDLPPLPGGGEPKPRVLSPEEIARLRAEAAAIREATLKRWAEAEANLVRPLTNRLGQLTTYDGLAEEQKQITEATRPEREAMALEDRRKTAVYLASLPGEERHLFETGRIAVGMWDGDRPIIYGLDGVEAAIASNADVLWPGGSSGLNLSGAGQMIGIWDGGTVLEGHQEFQGRVINIQTETFNAHATWVASTIAAAGVVADARG